MRQDGQEHITRQEENTRSESQDNNAPGEQREQHVYEGERVICCLTGCKGRRGCGTFIQELVHAYVSSEPSTFPHCKEEMPSILSWSLFFSHYYYSLWKRSSLIRAMHALVSLL